jgi:hypothetical protein
MVTMPIPNVSGIQVSKFTLAALPSCFKGALSIAHIPNAAIATVVPMKGCGFADLSGVQQRSERSSFSIRDVRGFQIEMDGMFPCTSL